ncbi:MAG: nitroreductase family protein [Lachnospiraceae bacterium]
MNTIECIKTRRSIRSFTDQPVSHETLEKIVAAAAYAPSWKNTQVTRYIAVDNPELKAQIANECCAAHNGDIINHAPLLVATTMIKYRSGYERDGSYSTSKEDRWQMYDCGIAGQTFCLAAHEYGVSTVIMGIFDYEKVSELLQIPDNQEIASLIAVGYAASEVPAPKKKTVEDLLSYR